MNQINIGLSGCKIELLDNGVIRKHSASNNYNNRLMQQIKKQSLFSNLILRNIETPKILNICQDGLYSFDMQYVPGYSFVEYFSSANSKQINFVLETLQEYIQFFINNSKNYNINDQLTSKIDQLKVKSQFNPFLNFIKDQCNSKELRVPKTFCHGDLTFSNIIFHKNRLFLIDFLDSYVDSILCDLVKLKQEVYYKWNLKLLGSNSMRVNQAYDYIWMNIEKSYSEYINTKEFEILDSLNLLRIEPYISDDHHRKVLVDIIKGLNLYEKFDRADGRKIFSIS